MTSMVNFCKVYCALVFLQPIRPLVYLSQLLTRPLEANNLADEMPAKPTDANTVAEIKAWLDVHGVSYPSSAIKANLLALVNDTDA
ncbi:hypothetical protein EFS57_07460 [Leuconostoc falkenbergense]|nr:hypothetical protein [Leuconostoc falkenbergense]